MDKQTLFDVEYLPLRISLISQKQADLPPYLGSTIRGVIGHSLCQVDKDAYEFFYNNHKQGVNEQDIVKPYMIVPPEAIGIRKIFKPGEELVFEFVLYGTAIKYVNSLLIALQNIHQFHLGAGRYPFKLLWIVNSHNQQILWWKDTYYETGKCIVKLPQFEMDNVTGVVVKLCTPLRIRRDGELLENITFQTLIRNIIKRIEAITKRYGGWIDVEEAQRIYVLAKKVELTKEELRVEHLERYSNHKKKKMKIDGLLGEIQFDGDLTPFVPWLLAAQNLHIGRSTTFGMGRIMVYFK